MAKQRWADPHSAMRELEEIYRKCAGMEALAADSELQGVYTPPSSDVVQGLLKHDLGMYHKMIASDPAAGEKLFIDCCPDPTVDDMNYFEALRDYLQQFPMDSPPY